MPDFKVRNKILGQLHICRFINLSSKVTSWTRIGSFKWPVSWPPPTFKCRCDIRYLPISLSIKCVCNIRFLKICFSLLNVFSISSWTRSGSFKWTVSWPPPTFKCICDIRYLPISFSIKCVCNIRFPKICFLFSISSWTRSGSFKWTISWPPPTFKCICRYQISPNILLYKNAFNIRFLKICF